MPSSVAMHIRVCEDSGSVQNYDNDFPHVCDGE